MIQNKQMLHLNSVNQPKQKQPKNVNWGKKKTSRVSNCKNSLIKPKNSRIFDPNPLKDCFMGGVPIDCTEQELENFFAKEYPEIEIKKVLLVRKKNQKKVNKGFGFVCLKTEESLQKLLKIKPTYKNKQLDIRRANKFSKQQEMAQEFYSTRVFARCIPEHITDDDFRQIFAKKFDIIRGYIVRDHQTGQSKGLGFIDFSTIEEAKRCLERSTYTIKGIKIPVTPFKIEKKLKYRSHIVDQANHPKKTPKIVQNKTPTKPKLPERDEPKKVIIRRPAFSFSSKGEHKKSLDRNEFLMASIQKRLNEAPMNYKLNQNFLKNKRNLRSQYFGY